MEKSGWSVRAPWMYIAALMVISIVLIVVADEDRPGLVGHLDVLGTGLLIGCVGVAAGLLARRRRQP